ncbi:class I SAM-dependent methyltransferase [Nodosilinea sp. E11]|uniref:class I SAM-dependent methyltransferase n=1 Tax=Nodosilinea sp. E11 TaxID=3037479 RepID=UPI002934452D|nr:class I SAM-dependent methyltransferase [Nodosilinea sp. E11]WOD40829.1 class I SAM-dependent methyltransferase [Nodosilinea sp. E11]
MSSEPMNSIKKAHRGWVYSEAGDYHRYLDLGWSYAPTYLQKIKLTRKFIESLNPDYKILDIGCGEGVFVEEYVRQGRDIQGIDLNYESEFVRQGNILDLPFPDSHFDTIMLLDVFEHIAFKDQPKALTEIYRVLKPEGLFFTSIPNLAHFNSRVIFSIFGRLDRTDNELDHLGERPFKENRELLEAANFKLLNCVGVTLSVPYIYRRLICRHAKQLRFLHDLFEPIARAAPGWAMLDFFTCQK